MKIGTLNFFSWYRTAAVLKTIENREKADMDITAVQELRWIDNGNQ